MPATFVDNIRHVVGHGAVDLRVQLELHGRAAEEVDVKVEQAHAERQAQQAARCRSLTSRMEMMAKILKCLVKLNVILRNISFPPFLNRVGLEAADLQANAGA